MADTNTKVYFISAFNDKETSLDLFVEALCAEDARFFWRHWVDEELEEDATGAEPIVFEVPVPSGNAGPFKWHHPYGVKVALDEAEVIAA